MSIFDQFIELLNNNGLLPLPQKFETEKKSVIGNSFLA